MGQGAQSEQLPYPEVTRRYDSGDLSNTDYLTPPEHIQLRMGEARKKFKDLAQYIHGNIPTGREKSLALTKVEEALMWTMKALVVNIPQE